MCLCVLENITIKYKFKKKAKETIIKIKNTINGFKDNLIIVISTINLWGDSFISIYLLLNFN